MSREKQRQRNRLLKLADFIEKNPNAYDQREIKNCIVGLGVRINFKTKKFETFEKLGKFSIFQIFRRFSNRFGVPRETVASIFVNSWGNIDRSFKNEISGRRRKASTAARLLRKIAG